MRHLSILLVLAAALALLGGCGGGSGTDLYSGEQASTTLTASDTEISALNRAIEDAEIARRIYLNPEQDVGTRIKAMHITLLLAAMGNKGFSRLIEETSIVVKELEQIAENPGEPPQVKTAALDLAQVGKAMISPSVANPALFVGYPGYLPYSPWEGLVPVPEQMLTEKLAPDECLVVVQKVEGLQADRFEVKDESGRVVYRCLWIPVEIIKALKWCRNGTAPPTWVADDPQKPGDEVIQILKVPQLMRMVELFVKLVGSSSGSGGGGIPQG